MKTFAAVGSDYVVWKEPCATCATTYQTAGEMYYNATRTVRLDLETGQRCHTEQHLPTDYSSVHGHHLYGYWSDGAHKYLVDVDLDDPGLNWECK